jgi:hypothetical protein
MGIQVEELKSRVQAKKLELQARLARAKADAQGRLGETGAAIEHRIRELEAYLKDGWENLTEKTAEKINDWLRKS